VVIFIPAIDTVLLTLQNTVTMNMLRVVTCSSVVPQILHICDIRSSQQAAVSSFYKIINLMFVLKKQ